jgi:hypothetical protein
MVNLSKCWKIWTNLCKCEKILTFWQMWTHYVGKYWQKWECDCDCWQCGCNLTCRLMRIVNKFGKYGHTWATIGKFWVETDQFVTKYILY